MPLLLCVGLVLVPLVQLIPLPPWAWTSLSNRKPLEATFDLLNLQMPWMPASMSPNATWLSALSLLPPIAIFLSGIQLHYRQRRLIILLMVATGIISVFIGLVQVAQGPASGFRFFNLTNEIEAVGFFANRNHLSALIYTLILFISAWVTEAVLTMGTWRRLKRLDMTSVLPLAGSFFVLAILLSGQAVTRSRAGIGLTIVALCGVFCMTFADRRRAPGVTPAKLILCATILAVVFSVQFALYRILERFATDPLTDARVAFAHTTIAAAEAYMPFGSGIGTFVPIYAMFERPKDATMGTFVNHAHNDFIEVWLEAGILGIVLICVFAVWFVQRAAKIWRNPPKGAREIDHSLARSATMSIALLIGHSLVDYPLHTSAMTAVFAFCCALLIEPMSCTASESSSGGENPTNDMMRRSAHRTARTAVTLAGRSSGVISVPPEPAGQRWGEDIDWPDEWRDKMQKLSRDG